eukprot:m.135195 g.135195  ORF g.135195 m.135195 type:complete len:76 (-) comp13897_c0_seq1:3479-3706(-)
MADLYEAAQQGNLKEVTRFVSQGGRDINWALPTGWTALHVAAQHNRAQVITTLIENGASIEARAKLDSTALHLAA